MDRIVLVYVHWIQDFLATLQSEIDKLGIYFSDQPHGDDS